MLSTDFLLCYNMFYEYGIQGFFSSLWSYLGKHSGRVWVWGWLGGTRMRALGIRKSARGMLEHRQRKANYCAGQAGRTGPSSSMCPGHVQPNVLKLRKSILVIFLLVISTAWIVGWIGRIYKIEKPHIKVCPSRMVRAPYVEYYIIMRLNHIAIHIEGGEI